ncbi:hypothetical protein DFQ27_009528 [Actinomortierella ambigua]|uniref:Uncharacterized protein n=1 Tax=Actinomortierella ambigua TaxID=1343610 RepID=A0A9P6U9P5_9FUNG|nr:hypothetical protein DFQ27_009528 [Actinomortierella ambigua]
MATNAPSQWDVPIQQTTDIEPESSSDKMGRLIQSTIVYFNVRPAWDWAVAKYNESPLYLRLSLWAFVVSSSVPLICFLGFMTAVTMICLIVGAMTFGVIEGGSGVVASAILLPTLAVTTFIASGIGATIFVAMTALRAVMVVIQLFSGQGQQDSSRRQRARGKSRSE